MARKLRLEYPGACYHVINRGNYRKAVFAAEGAAAAFEACLFESCEKFGWCLHAYVVMRNHFHLAVETPEPNLSEGMKWLQGTWAMRFNRFRGETGRPFQGRYKGLHVEPGHCLAQVCHYIHLNPVRARVVDTEHLSEFIPSSFVRFSKPGRPAFLNPTTVLMESGGLPDTSAGWRKYQEYLGVLAKEELELKNKRFGRLSRGWMVGSKEFGQALKKDFLQRGAELERAHMLGVGAMKEWQTDQWQEKLKAAAAFWGTDLGNLPQRKSAAEKVRLAALMKLTTSASNQWLSEQLDMGKPASLSQFFRRFKLSKKDQEPGFLKALAMVRQ